MILLVLLVTGGLAAAFAALGGTDEEESATYLWIVEKTVAAPEVVPEPLTDTLDDLAASGGGELRTYAVGEYAVRLEPVSLRIERQGDVVQDERLREAELDRRLDGLRAQLRAADVGNTGYSLYAALQAIVDEAQQLDGPLDVWFSTTLLTGSVDPLDIAALTAADPRAAAEQVLAGPIGRLRLDGVTVHPLFLVPVGAEQQPLTAADEAWRTDFVDALGSGLGAIVTDPVRSDPRRPPWPMSSEVEPVEPLRDPTPGLPCAATGCPIDNLAFAPRTADLVDEDATRRRVEEFVAALPPGDRRIRVTGYTAAFGSAQTSRDLSRERARVIGLLLEQAGVRPEEYEIEGVGHDRRADPTRGPQDQAQRVVVLTVEDGP